MKSHFKNKKDSIYLKAIEYSSKKPFEGVKFNEVTKYIQRISGENFDAKSELAFFKFFLDSHYSDSVKLGNEVVSQLKIIDKVRNNFREKYDSGKIDVSSSKDLFKHVTEEATYFLNGEGDKRYVEYIELKEARNNAKQAFYFSIWAIIISLIALLFSPLIEHLWSLTNLFKS